VEALLTRCGVDTSLQLCRAEVVAYLATVGVSAGVVDGAGAAAFFPLGVAVYEVIEKRLRWVLRGDAGNAADSVLRALFF
jgi:hypothetical protein